jgi:hypothetical protein
LTRLRSFGFRAQQQPGLCPRSESASEPLHPLLQQAVGPSCSWPVTRGVPIDSATTSCSPPVWCSRWLLRDNPQLDRKWHARLLRHPGIGRGGVIRPAAAGAGRIAADVVIVVVDEPTQTPGVALNIPQQVVPFAQDLRVGLVHQPGRDWRPPMLTNNLGQGWAELLDLAPDRSTADVDAAVGQGAGDAFGCGTQLQVIPDCEQDDAAREAMASDEADRLARGVAATGAAGVNGGDHAGRGRRESDWMTSSAGRNASSRLLLPGKERCGVRCGRHPRASNC